MVPVVMNSVHLDEDQRNELMIMASLNFKFTNMAVCLGIDIDLFVKDASTPYTDVWLLINRGIQVIAAAPEMKLHELASEGNITAIQELEKLKKQKNFQQMIEQLDEDEL